VIIRKTKTMSLLFTTRQQLGINNNTFHLPQQSKPATTTKSNDDSIKQQQQQQQQKTLSTDKKEILLFKGEEEEVEEGHFHHTKNLPFIERGDVRIGSCLGKGSFSKVYKIKNKTRLDILLSSFSSSTPSTNTTKKNISTLSPPIKKNVGDSSSLFSALSSLVSLPSNNNTTNKKCNNKIKKKYALKVLRNKIMRKEEKYILDAKLDMKKEIQALSVFKHENINNIYGYGFCSSPDNIPFLIIEQIESTLHERMEDWQYFHDNYLHYNSYHANGGFGVSIYLNVDDNNDRDKNEYHSSLLVKEKISIALQIMNAIQYMHDCGFVYRDLKPQNTGLMHSTDANRATKVKLFDFGTCRKLPNDDSKCENKDEDEYYKMTIVGSPRYMAPELHGYRKYNEKVDIYSWSILFYEILTLRKAYPTYSPKEYYKKIYKCNQRPKFFDHNINATSYDLSVPEEIQKILQHSWKGDVSKRYSSKDALEKLQSYCDKHSILFLKEEQEEEDFTMENTMSTLLSSSDNF